MSANSSKSNFLALINNIPNNHESAYLEVYLRNGKRHFTTWKILEEFKNSDLESFKTVYLDTKHAFKSHWLHPKYEVKPEDVKEIGYNWEIYPIDNTGQ